MGYHRIEDLLVAEVEALPVHPASLRRGWYVVPLPGPLQGGGVWASLHHIAAAPIFPLSSLGPSVKIVFPRFFLLLLWRLQES